jgi:hypothetical protein
VSPCASIPYRGKAQPELLANGVPKRTPAAKSGARRFSPQQRAKRWTGIPKRLN